ncbi:MAG TPA: pyridoxamine 5'-phosphate oxidase family protein [Aliidongia sp.]|uniref:pyridoxamine 5'-phosphate oxidase family protein n=1 Tax=Aliidongia sp. TaxID=1914230 RepID=UPI002DDDA7CB|nr:pyridoxamine 5'-phosphate oxidase family protein [Aliidongia sp.]HEV2673424.1 pyridoxamine 5'-phosphate oxidase family protein [Aliidongia sp.]
MSDTFIPLDGWGHDEAPFHEGERAIQRRVGVETKMGPHGRRAIRSFMPDQHREFFAQLPFLIAGTVDRTGQPWASILTGRPGFLATPDDRTLTVAALPPTGDPLNAGLVPESPIGLLGIELPTRRRNRANGIVTRLGPNGFIVAIRQSFGNCPKYIQARTPETVGIPSTGDAPRISDGLDETDRALIAGTDTFFIATAHTAPAAGFAGGVDVSHRGGKPGFVRVEGNRLTVPDFIGNFFFNTLGNLAVEPRAGLLFPDFATGDLLYLAATGEIVWDGPEVEQFTGAQRLMRLDVTRAIRLTGALPFRWSAPEYSSVLDRTGQWGATEQ